MVYLISYSNQIGVTHITEINKSEAEFKRRPAELLKEFDASITVEIECRGYEISGGHIEIDSPSTWDGNCNVVRQGFSLVLGSNIDESDLRK